MCVCIYVEFLCDDDVAGLDKRAPYCFSALSRVQVSRDVAYLFSTLFTASSTLSFSGSKKYTSTCKLAD